MPLVAECTTRSTPWSSGRCTGRGATCESTTVKRSRDRADGRRGRRGRAGFAGVSTRTRVGPAGPHRRGELVGVCAVDERDVDAEAGTHAGEQQVGHRERAGAGRRCGHPGSTGRARPSRSRPCPSRTPAPPRPLRARAIASSNGADGRVAVAGVELGGLGRGGQFAGCSSTDGQSRTWSTATATGGERARAVLPRPARIAFVSGRRSGVPSAASVHLLVLLDAGEELGHRRADLVDAR